MCVYYTLMRLHRQHPFAKVGEDIKSGDVLEILNGGRMMQTQFGEQFMIFMRLANGLEKEVRVNKRNSNKFVDAWGPETEDWIGKKLKVEIKEERMGKVMYMEPYAPAI